VAAALLVAPPDLARADLPPQVQGWAPGIRLSLPFASTTVLSSDDPFCDLACGQALAADWGGEVVTLGLAGHVNADSGLGDWPRGLALLRAMMQRAGLVVPPAGPETTPCQPR
jgi:predicted alpha/beta hydrolase family esterase